MSAKLVATPDGRYVDANDEALAIMGRSRENLLGSRIGDFAGPHAELARTVWARLAGAGKPIPTGEASVYRPDGTVVRVRYTRISRTLDGVYELEFELVGPGEGPPLVDKPSAVLDQWRAADRDRDSGAQADGEVSSDALRTLYQHGVRARADTKRS